MKFAMSYSCGKDSTLALHKAIREGHTPSCLLVMVNKDVNRSYFHGADSAMLQKYETALGIPMILCPTDGAGYHLALEKGLKQAKALGITAAVFGDIDIAENREWEEERCRHTGLTPLFPLWRCGREDNVRELLELGYQCLIKSINHTLLPESLLGQYLSEDSMAAMKKAGIDVCGENGEYHTLVTGGPIFQSSLDFKTGTILRFGDYSVIETN